MQHTDLKFFTNEPERTLYDRFSVILKNNTQFMVMADFKYEITRELGVLSESKSGWTRELNLVSWNGAEAKFDIRDWSPGHERMGKGVSLSGEEAAKLRELLDKFS